MILRVNPNRMELLKLRRRLALARRGHKLLQDKLEEMMRRFLILLKDIDKAEEDFRQRTATIMRQTLYCRISSRKADFEEALSRITTRMDIAVSTQRILNVRTPVFDIRELEISKQYDFFTTSAQMDAVIAQAPDYIRALLKLAQALKSLQVLSFEIERTRRRVNALEYMLIPSIEETIRSITQKLNELERGNLTRLMRVKEIVRSH
ncbi:MAG: V-type ATP synthase subunit D [Candidatus Omnitrophica bacterium]|nr:V-type ATP synthase subunit D [Candidatus Omnitrophota bacterium]